MEDFDFEITEADFTVGDTTDADAGEGAHSSTTPAEGESSTANSGTDTEPATSTDPAADPAEGSTPAGDGGKDGAKAAPFVYKHLGHEVSFSDDTEKQALEKVASKLGISTEDVIKNLQKGAEYDHKVSELQQTRPAAKLLKDFSARLGVSDEQTVELMKAALEKSAMANAKAELKTKYPDLPDAPLEDMAKLSVEQSQSEQVKAAIEAQRAAEEAQRAPWVAFIKNFREDFPDEASLANLPECVLNCDATGETPTEAYLRYKLELSEAKAAAAQKDAQNSAKAVGSAKSNAVADASSADDFEKEFLCALST